MKNRKTVVVAFLLVAVMLLGVGYAAVTNVLDITGSIKVTKEDAEKEFNEDIYFQGVIVDGAIKENGVVAGDNLGYTANINTNNNDKAQFTITGIKATGESKEITYRIKNDSELVATVTLKSIYNSDTNENVKFSYYFGTVGTTETTIAAGGYVDVTVKVVLDGQITDTLDASFLLELNASAG
jgi:cytochrome c oxidase assembly protein Cox11